MFSGGNEGELCVSAGFKELTVCLERIGCVAIMHNYLLFIYFINDSDHL